MLLSGQGVNERAQVVAEAKSLRGKVVSPDDPTIALEAKGYAGRTAVFEADASGWRFGRQNPLVKEVDGADYVITLQHLRSPAGMRMPANLLRSRGFEEARFQTTSSPVYVLWRRARPGL